MNIPSKAKIFGTALGVAIFVIAAYEDFLQTDTPINPENSGGLLVNMRAEVIGMNSVIATGGGDLIGGGQSAGVGFAIPSNMIKVLLPTLIKGEKIIRGMLGVVIQDLDADLAKNFHVPNNKGALVSQVAKDSSAARAGIKSGDVIVKFGDVEINDSRQLRNLFASTPLGKIVIIKVIRSGDEFVLRTKIAKAITESIQLNKSKENSVNRLSNLGLSVQILTHELAQQFDLQEEAGVLISNVEDGSSASAANLQVADLILEVNHEPVSNIKDLQTILNKASEQVLFLIKRKDISMFVVIKLK